MHYRHLKFDYRAAYDNGVKIHAQKVLYDMGISYQWSTPQTLGDCFQFWNCENIPEELPPYLSEFNDDPSKWINNGLSEEQSLKLTKR